MTNGVKNKPTLEENKNTERNIEKVDMTFFQHMGDFFLSHLVLFLILVVILFGVIRFNKSRIENSKVDYSFTERENRGEFEHVEGFNVGEETLELLYDLDMTNYKVVTLDGEETTIDKLKKRSDIPTLVIVNKTIMPDTSKSIEMMMDVKFKPIRFNIINLFVDDSEGFKDTKEIVNSNKNFYKKVGVISETELRRSNIGFTPAMLYLNSNNVVKNIALPRNYIESVTLLALAQNTIELPQSRMFTYIKGVEELDAQRRLEEQDGDIEDTTSQNQNNYGFTSIELSEEITYDKNIIKINEAKELGYFNHLADDESYETLLANNYGINLLNQKVETKEGELVEITNIIKDKSLPTVVIFGRKTCPYCVELWKAMKENPLTGVNVLEFITDGPASDYDEFLEVEGLDSMADKMYFNTTHLLDLLKVEYVPSVFVLSPQGTIVNVAPGGLPIKELQRIVDNQVNE